MTKLIVKYWIIGLAIACSVIAPVLGNRLIHIGPFIAPAGLIAAGFFVSMVDVVNELYGKNEARATLGAAVGTRLVVYLGLIPIVMMLPSVNGGLEDIFGQTMRLFVAGVITPFLANWFIDIPLFDYLRKMRGGFFARTNVTNLVSIFVESVLFIFISFAGTGVPLIKMFIGSTILRLLWSLVISPVLTLVVYAVRKNELVEQV